jgi:rhodanese-related sulfurtransferase
MDRGERTVTYKHLPSGEHYTIPYDRLVIATGAIPLCPGVPGVDLEGIMSLHSLDEADALRTVRDEGKTEKAVVAGGGLIGFEVCEALHLAGIGTLLISKMMAERPSGRVIGFQCIGPGDVSKRVATVAMAIRGGLTVEDLVNADLPYAPPYSLALDHVIVSAHVLENKLLGRMQGISASEVKNRLDTGANCFILDTRTPQEFEEMRIGIGETLIPLGSLRGRLNELPQEKNQEIILYCKISLRGYEAAAILQANGWRNLKVVEGGIMVWPYPREK